MKTLTLQQLHQSPLFTDDFKNEVIIKSLQTILDVNYPGLKFEKLSLDHQNVLFDFLKDNYIFKVDKNGIIAEPVSKSRK